MLGILVKRRTRVGTVLDGRGARLALNPIDGLDATLRDAGLLDAHRAATRAALPAWVRWVSFGAIAAACTAGVATIVSTLGDAFGWRVTEWWAVRILIVGWPTALVLGVASAIGSVRCLPAARARGLVAVGRCGVCAYPLEGLEPAADGCHVCPECNAAWRTTQTKRGDRV